MKKTEGLAYPKKFGYSNKVKIGNWFEENCSYKKQHFNHVTTNSFEYTPKPFTNADREKVLWDNVIKGEGNAAVYPINTSETRPDYFENFTTLYDLSYHIFPSCYKTTQKPMKGKLPDPANTFGNLTNYGITDYKNEKWSEDKNLDCYTTYEVQFASPKINSYLFKRWPRLTPVKTQYGKDHKPYTSDNPRFHNRNPVTWEK